MKRMAFSVVSVLVLGVVVVAEAKPGDPPPVQRVPGGSKTAAVYYRPSKDGTDTTPYPNDKGGAALSCKGTSDANTNFVIATANGRAFCKNPVADVRTAAVLCPEGGQLTSDDKYPPPVKGTLGSADACLRAGAPVQTAESYYTPSCATDSTGSGFLRQIKPGADTCEKTINRMRLQTPGDNGNILTLPTKIGPAAEIQPTPEQIESRSVRCPANATLETFGNAVVCKRN